MQRLKSNDIVEKINKGLGWLCLALAIYFIGSFILIAFGSMNYPFNIEWMEGQNIDVVQRITQGLPVYAPPTIEYVPFIYTPYYYYVSAFVSLFTGVGFFPARLVSTVAALGTGALIYAWVRKENGGWKTALIGSGFFFATYKITGRWFDIARVDSLFLFLTLAGLFVFHHYRGFTNALCAAALLTAAFFTKQAALLMALPMLAAGAAVDRRHALMTGGLLAVLLLAGIAASNAASGGWFSFYVFTVPAGHDIDHSMIRGFWMHDMFSRLTCFFALAGFVIAGFAREDWKKALSYASLAAGGIMASYISRMHDYGWINVLIPACAVLALLSGVAISRVERGLSYAAPLVGLLAAIQLGVLFYKPLHFIPDAESVATGNRFLARIAEIPGDIFMPDLQFVQTRIGKKSYALGMAGYDVLRSDLKEKNYVKNDLRRQLKEAIETGQFAAVMPGMFFPLPDMRGHYTFFEHLDYPREFVTGAVNVLRTDIFIVDQK